MKKIAAIVAPVICVCIAFAVVLNMFVMPRVKYDRFIKNLPDVKVGDTIEFGEYEKDQIEWKVLDVQGNKALLISKYGLDCKAYNDECKAVTWEDCSLRKWLNDDFYNEAFTDEMKNMIIDSEITADKNPVYTTDPGNNTTDKLFLLSIPEAKKYFESDEERECKPTVYAVKNGVTVNDSNNNCWWWLRSPGYGSDGAAYVYRNGAVYVRGSNVDCSYGAVRPALWIDLKS